MCLLDPFIPHSPSVSASETKTTEAYKDMQTCYMENKTDCLPYLSCSNVTKVSRLLRDADCLERETIFVKSRNNTTLPVSAVSAACTSCLSAFILSNSTAFCLSFADSCRCCGRCLYSDCRIHRLALCTKML